MPSRGFLTMPREEGGWGGGANHVSSLSSRSRTLHFLSGILRPHPSWRLMPFKRPPLERRHHMLPSTGRVNYLSIILALVPACELFFRRLHLWGITWTRGLYCKLKCKALMVVMIHLNNPPSPSLVSIPQESDSSLAWYALLQGWFIIAESVGQQIDFCDLSANRIKHASARVVVRSMIYR